MQIDVYSPYALRQKALDGFDHFHITLAPKHLHRDAFLVPAD
jgi:hypothetical protein